MLDYELEWIRQDLAGSLSEVLGVTPERLVRQGIAICWPLDIANYAVMLAETDPKKSYRAGSLGVRYDEATVRALWQYREVYGGVGPFETVAKAMDAGALRIEFPEPAAYPHTPLKSRWGIAYMAYPNPTAVAYAELQDELEEGPRIKLTSGSGRTWGEVEKALEEQAAKKLRLGTPLTG